MEHMPSVHNVAAATAAVDCRQAQPLHLAQAGMKRTRDVCASRVPLLDLAQLHAPHRRLHVQHAVVAAVVRKVMRSGLRVQTGRAAAAAHHHPVALAHGVQLRVQRQVLALWVVGARAQ